jgi:hypothetical protein
VRRGLWAVGPRMDLVVASLRFSTAPDDSKIPDLTGNLRAVHVRLSARGDLRDPISSKLYKASKG